MLLVWLAGGTIPFVAMSPTWTSYTMTGVDQEMTGSATWRSASFVVNNMSCFAFIGGATNTTLKITVFNSTGNNDYNLTANWTVTHGGPGGYDTIMSTFQTAAYNSTHQIICIATVGTGVIQPYYTYGFSKVKFLSFLCDGSSIEPLFTSNETTIDNYLLEVSFIARNVFMSELANYSSNFYAFVSIKTDHAPAGTTYAYYAACFTKAYAGEIAKSGNCYGYMGLVAPDPSCVYGVAPGLIAELDMTVDAVVTKTSSAITDPLINQNGTSAVWTTSLTGAVTSPLIYFQCAYTNSTPAIVLYSCFYNGPSTTLYNDRENLTGLMDVAYYHDVYYSSTYIGFVCVNTTGGTNIWMQVIPSCDLYGNITNIDYYNLVDVEAAINSATHYRWSPCWLNSTTGYPDYAIGYYSTADGLGDKYYKVAVLGAITLVNMLQTPLDLPELSGTYENDTYTASSNELRLYSRTLTESFTNQMLTGVFIYLTNVNASLEVGAYHTLTASDTTAYRIGMTTVPVGWSGWVMFTGLSYSQPQGTRVSIAILPTDLTYGANYSIGVPVATLSTDVYNMTSTVMPSSIPSANTTLILSGQNKAVTYSLSYTAGGTTYTYVNIETENITVPRIIIPVIQNATIVASWTGVSLTGWVGSIFTRMYAGEGGWGQYAIIGLPILIMLIAGKHSAAIAGIISAGVCVFINAAAGASIFATATLALIGFVCLLMLFNEGKQRGGD